MMKISAALLVAAGALFAACSANDTPKVPLGGESVAAGDNQAAPSGLTGDAKRAIDSGNVLFRAKAYDDALVQYERSAKLAPAEIAPLLGIMMVADMKKDSKLAEATLPRIRKLDPEMADTSLVPSHSKILQTHPKVTAPKGMARPTS